MGKTEEANEILGRLLLSPTVALDAYPLAILYAGMGDRENALASLEKAYEQHAANMIYLKVEPFLDPLRGQPRFDALLAKLNLTA